MHVSRETVEAERERLLERAPTVVPIINGVRDDLAAAFDTDVEHVTEAAYRDAVDAIFADGDLAVNVAALCRLLRDLDVEDDYPGFVVDELLARELAGMLAGTQPRRLLGEATFHYADLHVHEGETAGEDDLLAALAAGFQSRLPGWSWTADASPYAIQSADEET
jgi:hypothetical protein